MVRLLTGDNEFALLAEQRRVVAEFLKEHDAFGLERLDADELEVSRLRDALLQLPFLVSKKLVVIKNVFAVKLMQEAILDLLGKIPDEVDVLLVDAKADKRTKLYKQLVASKQVDEFQSLKGAVLEKWVREYAVEQGGSITADVVRHLIDRIGLVQMQLAREIEKLSVFGEITRELVGTHTDQALRGTVFDLLDRTFAGDIDSALGLYDQLLAHKTDPSEILALIGWQLHVIALVKYAGEGSAADIAKATGLHPYVVGKTLAVVRTMTLDDIKQSVARALEADISIKSTPVDSVDVVRVLILELAG